MKFPTWGLLSCILASAIFSSVGMAAIEDRIMLKGTLVEIQKDYLVLRQESRQEGIKTFKIKRSDAGTLSGLMTGTAQLRVWTSIKDFEDLNGPL